MVFSLFKLWFAWTSLVSLEYVLKNSVIITFFFLRPSGEWKKIVFFYWLFCGLITNFIKAVLMLFNFKCFHLVLPNFLALQPFLGETELFSEIILKSRLLSTYFSTTFHEIISMLVYLSILCFSNDISEYHIWSHSHRIWCYVQWKI